MRFRRQNERSCHLHFSLKGSCRTGGSATTQLSFSVSSQDGEAGSPALEVDVQWTNKSLGKKCRENGEVVEFIFKKKDLIFKIQHRAVRRQPVLRRLLVSREINTDTRTFAPNIQSLSGESELSAWKTRLLLWEQYYVHVCVCVFVCVCVCVSTSRTPEENNQELEYALKSTLRICTASIPFEISVITRKI